MTHDGYPETVDEFDALPTTGPMHPPTAEEMRALLGELYLRRAIMRPIDRADE